MARGAAVVTKRFPSLRDEIESCFQTCPEFRAICQDLAAAGTALEHWQGLDSREALARAEEYRHLIGSLEAEALRLVAGQRAPPRKQS